VAAARDRGSKIEEILKAFDMNARD